MSKLHEFVGLQKRGVVTLPANVRSRLSLDRPGAQLEIIETDDGRFEIRGVLPVPADQAWFWSGTWQKMEREASSDLAAGRTRATESAAAFLDELDR